MPTSPIGRFALNALGVAYYGNKDYKSAVDVFKKAVNKDGKYIDAWYNLGMAQYQSGNVGEAKKAYTQLRKLGANAAADRLDKETGGAMARG